MSDDARKEPVNYDHMVSLHALEVLLLDYELPHAFNQLLVNPWMNIANTLLELNGMQSNIWARMLWFSRAVCDAISTSLTTRNPEPLEQALLTFMFWLRVCNQETGLLDLELVAAKQLCSRLKMQMIVDLDGNDCSQAAEAVPAPAQTEAATHFAKQQLLHESGIDLEQDRQSIGEAQPENIGRTTPENPDNILAIMAIAPESAMTQNLTEHSNSQDQWVQIDSQESLNQVAPQPTIENSTLDQHNLNTSVITMSPGETLMDIPTISESFHTPVDKVPEVKTAADTMNLSGQSTAKSVVVPIGVWLAFHDSDVSSMIKLAVYDRENDIYIFTNKQGFLVRQINTPDLLHLIESELVDIIERRLISRKPVA
jgi:hypothetical protein